MLAAHAAALGIMVACGDATAPPAEACGAPTRDEATVTIAWRNRPDTMRVLVRGAATVRAACDYVAGRSAANIPAGRIARGSGPSDPPVPFHYVPESVKFVGAAVELCDSRLLTTAAAVDDYFRGAGTDAAGTAPYCPWGAYPVAVR